LIELYAFSPVINGSFLPLLCLQACVEQSKCNC